MPLHHTEADSFAMAQGPGDWMLRMCFKWRPNPLSGLQLCTLPRETIPPGESHKLGLALPSVHLAPILITIIQSQAVGQDGQRSPALLLAACRCTSRP
ncbi:uncharacterized protein LOC132474528 isoform X1 [Gadus macrocephalus]|uniref:uncharacterized protein LOC132474528 isoform X1 n=1 Tax=Gadus macrocephalus TaxID=80720 RepID=UPI0028CB13EA|nr:uncharacterized protein LOC132474528 isoform X1 [Gadus macrocephalus]